MSLRQPKKTIDKEDQVVEQGNTSARQGTFKRKPGDQSVSQIKSSKVGKNNRPSERSFDQVSVSSNNRSVLGGNEEDNEKLMVLSNEAREALISMQRFDRFIYVAQSEKKLKVPIEAELKRLEKIKNSGNKLMKNTFFDNEITITCLYNHMKNLYEISKQLGSIVTLKAEIEVLQQKIIEQNVKFNKELKEAANSAKGKAAEDQQTLKQTLKIIDTLIFALKQKNVDKAKKKIETDLKRATDTRKQLLELVYNLLGRVGGGAVSESVHVEQGGADIYQVNLQKLIREQGSAEKNLSYLQAQKTQIQKTIKDPKSADFKHVYTNLNQTCVYLISLNTTIKQTEQILLSSQKKGSSNQTMSQADKQKLKQFQQLQSIINAFEQDGAVWHKQLQLITIKVENNDNFTADLNKNKKLLSGKKQINSTILNLVNSHLSLLELINSRSKDSSNINDLQNKYNKVLSTNQSLENDLKKLRKELQAANSNTNSKGQVEITKFINMLQQALTLKQGEQVIPLSQLQKIKKYIDLNKKKIPEDFHNTLNSIEILIKSLIDNQNYIKQRDQEIQKNQQAQTKELSNLDVMIKTLQKLLFSNDPINDGFLNKLKRNIEQNTSKIEKLGESPTNDLFKTYNNNVVKLVQLFSDAHRNSKSKVDSQSQSKQEIQQLRVQLKNKQSEITKLNKSISDLNTNLNKLQEQVTEFMSIDAENQKQNTDLQNQLQKSQKSNIQLKKKLSQSEARIEEYQQSLSRLQDDNKLSNNIAKQLKQLKDKISQFEKEAQQFNKEKQILNNEIDTLNLQIQELNRQLALAQQQLSILSIQDANKDKLLKQAEDEIRNIESDLQEQLNSLINQNRLLRETIDASTTGAEGEKTLINNLRSQNQNARRQNERFIKQIQSLKKEKENILKEVNTLQNNYKTISVDNEKLKSQVSGLNSNQAQNNQLNSLYEQLKRSYQQLERSYQQDKSNWEKDSNLLNQLNQEKDVLSRETNNLRSNFANLERQYKNQALKLESLQKSVPNISQINNIKTNLKELENRLTLAQQQNNDLHVKSNNHISQISQLQSQIRMLEAQLRQKTNEAQRLRTSVSTTKPVAAASSDYDAQRYLALKEQNIMLKEQIVQRDQRIFELQQSDSNNGVVTEISSISHISTSREQETIKRLQYEINQLRTQAYSQQRTSPSQQKLVRQNRQLSEAVRAKQISLQNALGDNEYLFKQLNRYKQIEGNLQTKVNSLNIEINSVRSNNQLNNSGDISIRNNLSVLSQEKSRLENDVRNLERDLNNSRVQSNNSNNEITTLKHKTKLLEETEHSQRKLIQQLRQDLKHVKTTNSNGDKSQIMERKLLDLENTIKSFASNNQELRQLRHENNELKQRLKGQQSSSRVRNYEVDDSIKGSDRLSELLKQKLQYVKTIKSMQTLLHAKDVKLMQLYDQRQIDLRHLIHENRKLQEEINRINERLVQQKVKILISPKSLQESLVKMQNQLLDLKRQNVILKQQIQTLEQQLIEKDKSSPHIEVKSSSNTVLDKNLFERVKILESERERLNERIALLSIYQRIETQSQALVSNVNKLLDGVLVFLGDSQDFADIDFSNNEFLPAINQYLNNQDYEQYFENVQDLIKDLFLRVVGRKNEILDKQAQQLLLLREKMQQLLAEQDYYEQDSYSKSFYERPSRRYEDSDTKKKASLIALQHLFKLYLKAKDPAVLKEISELLSISQGRSRFQY